MPSATILGYGRMGKEHERAYAEMGVRINTICSDSTLWEAAIGDSDYLSICSPDPVHAVQVIKGLEAGQHVFCEKPLCLTKRQLDKIRGIPGRLGVNYPLRHSKLKDMSWDHTVEMVYHWGRANKRCATWRREMADYSPILAGGCHLVDFFLYHGRKSLYPFQGFCPAGQVRIADFYHEGGTGRLICDLASNDGDHYQRINNWTNRDKTDKTACLKSFIEGEDTRNLCLEGMEVCLEMDRLSLA